MVNTPPCAKDKVLQSKSDEGHIPTMGSVGMADKLRTPGLKGVKDVDLLSGSPNVQDNVSIE